MTKDKESIACVAFQAIDQNILTASRPKRHDVVVLEALKHFTSDEVAKGIQGFLTSKGRFVGRKEAAKIAFEASQIPEPVSILMSEDLW